MVANGRTTVRTMASISGLVCASMRGSGGDFFAAVLRSVQSSVLSSGASAAPFPARTGTFSIRLGTFSVAVALASSVGKGSAGEPFSAAGRRSEEHTSELQSHVNLVCRLLLEKKKKK